MMHRLFQESPKSKLAIDTIIEELQLRRHPKADQIILILQGTKDFLSVTDPQFQKDRDGFNDAIIKKIFEKTSTRLTALQHELITDADGKDAFEFCLEAHQERLDLLKTNRDKIYLYYSLNDNPLKDILSSMLIKNTLS